MKKLTLAAFIALGLTAAIAPLALADTVGASGHSGPYDNTADSLGGRAAGTAGAAADPCRGDGTTVLALRWVVEPGGAVWLSGKTRQAIWCCRSMPLWHQSHYP